MPIRVPKAKAKKSKRGFFDRFPGSKIAANTFKDFEEIAKNSPGAALELGRAGRDLLYPGSISYSQGKYRTADRTERVENLAKAQVQGVKDLRHPLRHPGYSLLEILGLLPLPSTIGTKVVAPLRLSRVAKATKVAKRPPTRVLRHKVKTKAQAERFQKARPRKGGYTPGYSVIHEEVPASKVVTTRAAQKGIDKLREKSNTMSRRKMEKVIAQKQDYRGRLTEEMPKGVKAATKEAFTTSAPIKKINPLKRGGAGELVREGNALIRGLRLYRGAYVPPNWAGSQAVNLIHSGPYRYAKGVRGQHRGRKNMPETAQAIDRAGGETIGQAMMDTGGSGPIGTFARGVGTTLGKVTDRAPRNRIWREEARRMEYEPADIDGLISAAKAGNEQALKDFYLISDRAERSSIKFSRVGPMRDVETGDSLSRFNPLQTIDKAMADNIFLYKWLTASTRYGGHMVGEHPILTAALANASKDAPNIEDVLKEYPDFMGNYIPTGQFRGDNPMVRNPTAAGLFDMPFETLQSLRASGSDIRELSDILNPMQAMGMNAITGFDPFRDQEISEFKDSPWDRAKFGFLTQTRSIPWLEWLRFNDSQDERENRLFPLSPEDIALRQLLGSSITPTGFPVNPKVAAKMARQQATKGKSKRKRKRNLGY